MLTNRPWFPISFFDPSAINEDDLHTVLDGRPALDAIADHIEALSRELGIGLTVWAGLVHPERQTLGLLIQCDPVIRQNIPAHREFTRRLCQAYHCENAGVDVKDDAVWLWKIDFARVLDLSGVNHDRTE